MDWVKHLTKNDGLEFGLVKKFGSEGYHVYWKTVAALAAGNYFFKPLIEDEAYFEYIFVSVKAVTIKNVYSWLGQQTSDDGTPKLVYKELDGGKLSVFLPNLERLNPEYARKHADIIERQRIAAERLAGVKPAAQAEAPVIDEDEGPAVKLAGPPAKRKRVKKQPVVSDNPVVADIIATWNKIPAVIHCVKRTAKRDAEVLTRLDDEFFAENWKEALRKVYQSDFLTGRAIKDGGVHSGWRPDFDWFIRADGRKTATIVLIMEGKYDNASGVRESD